MAILLIPNLLMAADWYAASNGSGSGTIISPLKLEVAITNASINPGDTLWLRGGTYVSSYTNATVSAETNQPIWFATINGIAGNLIAIRSYPGEWAKIDGPWYFPEHYGTNLLFRDLEFYDTLKGRHTTNAVPPTPWVHFANKNPPCGNVWINCIIHDVDNVWNGAEASIRGCVIWHVGVDGLEHVCYPVGAEFVGNISAWHACNVINLNQTAGSVVRSNIMFGSGQTVSALAGGDIQAGSGDFEVSYNYFYNYYPTNQVADRAMYLASSPSSNIIVSNNYAANGTILSFTSDPFVSVAIGGNTFRAQGGAMIARPVSNGVWTVNNNHYTASTGNTVVFREYVTNFNTFAQWKSDTGFDANSTSTNSANPPDAVFVIPNQDQTKRAHIAVYNFTKADNVTVSVAGVLNGGDRYWLYNAQDYNSGAIQSGTLTGTSISAPMTNLTTAPVLYGTNWGLANPPAMSPEFGAFVLVGAAPSSATANTLHAGTLRSPP